MRVQVGAKTAKCVGALMNEISITGGGPLSIACEMLKYWCTLDFQHWAYYIALDIKQRNQEYH